MNSIERPGGSGGVKRLGIMPWNDAIKMAKKDGYAEIIYLDAVEHRFVEEVGQLTFSV